MSETRSYIAVVDDEPAILKAFERLLRVAQFEVATFSSGAAFIESLQQRLPDCVVLDLQMPGMSGFDVLARLASDAATSRVPVVIATAYEWPEAQQRATAGGVAAYFRKPVDAEPLLDAIRGAIPPKTP